MYYPHMGDIKGGTTPIPLHTNTHTNIWTNHTTFGYTIKYLKSISDVTC